MKEPDAVALPLRKVTAVPSEIPDHFTPTTSSFDYTRRDVMIPMRDGVKLETVILIPRGVHTMRPSLALVHGSLASFLNEYSGL